MVWIQSCKGVIFPCYSSISESIAQRLLRMWSYCWFKKRILELDFYTTILFLRVWVLELFFKMLFIPQFASVIKYLRMKQRLTIWKKEGMFQTGIEGTAGLTLMSYVSIRPSVWYEIRVLWANITHIKSHTIALGFWLTDLNRPFKWGTLHSCSSNGFKNFSGQRSKRIC